MIKRGQSMIKAGLSSGFWAGLPWVYGLAGGSDRTALLGKNGLDRSESTPPLPPEWVRGAYSI